jgi:hypothetical protein
MMRDALESGRSFNLIHFASSYKFDIFPLTSEPFHQSQFSRREMRDIVLGGVSLALPVASAEDTLLRSWFGTAPAARSPSGNGTMCEALSPCSGGASTANICAVGQRI